MQLALRNYYSECSLHNIYYYSQESCKHHDFFFFTFRVLETVPSVPTSEMDCSVCLAVPKACQGRMTRLCGNMQMRWKCASYATKTALKGKSIVQPTWELAVHFHHVANICMSECWCRNVFQARRVFYYWHRFESEVGFQHEAILAEINDEIGQLRDFADHTWTFAFLPIHYSSDMLYSTSADLSKAYSILEHFWMLILYLLVCHWFPLISKFSRYMQVSLEV